jgi:ribosomal protein S9
MTSWEIFQGDYGRTYRGRIKNDDVSDCTATIYVFDDDGNVIINGKSCNVSYSDPNSYIDYTVAQTDFATADPKVYDVIVLLTKGGVVERIKKFYWEVFKKEP